MNKKIEKFKFTLDKPKSKFKLKELINNFSVTNIPKKRELLIPLKIKKKNNFKKSETINELPLFLSLFSPFLVNDFIILRISN